MNISEKLLTKAGFDPEDESNKELLQELNESALRTGNTYNEVLDDESKYCNVDLLKHLDDNHLLKRLSIYLADLSDMPVNTVFLIGVGVFGSMAARKWAVLYPDKRQLPIGLYTVLEQPSGTGKTRCLTMFQDPFYKKLKAILRDETELQEEFNKHVENGDSISEEENEQNRERIKKINRLKSGLFVSNSTPEALENTLTDTLGFFSAASSEQGLFNSLFGMLYNDKPSNNDLILNAFDGGYISSHRVTRKGYSGNVVGGVVCFAQDGTIETLLKASNGTGLSERFLMLAEQHHLGYRNHLRKIKPRKDIEEEYTERCQFIEDILNNPIHFDRLSDLIISDNGFQKINEYRNQIEPYLKDGGRYSHTSLRGAASKINMQIMKLAALLHLLDSTSFPPDPNINDKYVISAIGIANELIEANLKICLDKGIMGVKAEFRAVLNYLSKDSHRPRTERQIKNSMKSTQPFKDFTGVKAELIQRTLDDMVNQRLIKITFQPNTEKDKQPVKLYSLAQ